jgi:ketosteroid isomerase-like protein
LLSGCSEAAGEAGADSERGAVDAYVEALNSSDEEALAQLAPPGNDAEAEAADLIRKNGGRSFKVEQVDISHEFGADFASANLVARGTQGEELRQTLGLSKSDDRWYVGLGENPEGRQKSPASTSKP